MRNSFTKKILFGLMLVTVIFGGLNVEPKQAHAAFPVLVDGNVSYTAIQDTINIYAQKVKSFLLDGIEWHVAKLMVQQITADTVQWINSGFKGSPAFLTNPGGYFANVADQETGAFIANTGILSGLCSPFNIDVRLSLALGGAGYGEQEKYTCTLNSVIQNVQNSTINGYTIKGFMNGDFKQGGWPAFISISDPNNNAMGTYLQAQSELNQRIGSIQAGVNQQLVQGGGFLSWQSCKDVTPAQVKAVAGMTGNSAALSSFQNASNQNAVNNSLLNIQQGGTLGGASGANSITGGTAIAGAATAPSLNLGNNSSIQTSVGSNGQTSYQDCQTETPGSLINSQLEKQLGSGIEQLNLANSINEIVDALFSQLVSTILHKGLASVSEKPSGDTQSAILQLSAEAESQNQYSTDSANIQSTLSPYVTSAKQISNIYQQAVSAFEKAKNDYVSAQQCFQDLQSGASSYGNAAYANRSTISSDLSKIASDLVSLYASEQPYQTSLTTANNNLMFIDEQLQSVSNISSPTDLQTVTQNIQNFISTQPVTSSSDALTTAQDSLTTAQGLADSYDGKANNYISACESLGNGTGN